MSVTFSNFLNNCPQTDHKVAVFTFGRMNPITKGHQLVIEQVCATASSVNGDPYVFLSSTHDSKKNPLRYEQKVSLVKEAFPQTPLVEDCSIKDPFQAILYLNERGYTDITMVVGSDRVEEFTKRFATLPEDKFGKLSVVSAGFRDVDSNHIQGMSGTKARECALQEDIGAFRAATGWDGEFATRMMKLVKEGLTHGV